MPVLRNHTQLVPIPFRDCQVAQNSDPQTKTCQRLWLPQRTVDRLRRIKHENTTRCINKLAVSGLRMFRLLIMFVLT
jgi:hypothetical protein